MSRPANGILAIQKYSFYLLFVLKFPGMSNETPKLVNFVWACFSWISVFLPLHMSFCFFKTVYDGFGLKSMDTLSNTGIQGLWLFCSFVTMLNYKLKTKGLNDIIKTIEREFLWRSPKGKTYVDMEKIHRYAKIVSMFWQFFPTSTVVVSLLRPLFSTPLELPIAIYPIDENNPYQFALAYLLQAWAQIIVVCSFAVGSSFFFSFGLLCSGQFNITRCALKNLIFTSGVYKRFPELLQDKYEPDSADYHFTTEMRDINFLRSDFQSSDDNLLLEDIESIRGSSSRNLSAEEIRNFRVALKDVIEQHLVLIKLCGMMENFLNFFVILRVLEVTLQMCFMAFVYAKTSDIFVLLFGVLAAVDLFLITYPAEYINEQNSLIGTSLLMGSWYLVSKYFRNDFLIIIMFSQQHIKFTAGKILPLNPDRLRQAITTAFSYYTLLSSFDKDFTI